MVPFKVVLSLLAVSAAVAAPTQSLTALCYQDITDIDTNVRKLIKIAGAYHGGLVAFLPEIPFALQAAAATASGGLHSSLLPKTLPLDDLFRLAEHVNKTLAVDNPIVVEKFIEKKDQYERSGLRATVHSNLKLFLDLHLRFANNILDRVPDDAPADRIAVAKADIDAITVALQKGIMAFE